VTALVAIEALKLLRAAAGDGLAAATGVAPNADACFEGTVKSGVGGGLFWEMDLNVGAWKGAIQN